MSNESDDRVSCVGSFLHSLFLCEASHFFFFCLTPLLLPVAFRLSGTIRASSPWDVHGREAMWWVAWWTWLNAP